MKKLSKPATTPKRKASIVTPRRKSIKKTDADKENKLQSVIADQTQIDEQEVLVPEKVEEPKSIDEQKQSEMNKPVRRTSKKVSIISKKVSTVQSKNSLKTDEQLNKKMEDTQELKTTPGPKRTTKLSTRKGPAAKADVDTLPDTENAVEIKIEKIKKGSETSTHFNKGSDQEDVKINQAEISSDTDKIDASKKIKKDLMKNPPKKPSQVRDKPDVSSDTDSEQVEKTPSIKGPSKTQSDHETSSDTDSEQIEKAPSIKGPSKTQSDHETSSDTDSEQIEKENVTKRPSKTQSDHETSSDTDSEQIEKENVTKRPSKTQSDHETSSDTDSEQIEKAPFTKRPSKTQSDHETSSDSSNKFLPEKTKRGSSKSLSKKPSQINDGPEISTDSERDTDLSNVNSLDSDSSIQESDESLTEPPKKALKTNKKSKIIRNEPSQKIGNKPREVRSDGSSESESASLQKDDSSVESDSDSDSAKPITKKPQKKTFKKSSGSSETDDSDSEPVKPITKKPQKKTFKKSSGSSETDGTSDSQDVRLKIKQPSSKETHSSSNDRSPRERAEGLEHKTLFIKGFGREIAELHIEEEFSKFGTISSIRMPRDRHTGQNKGFCFIDYEDPASTQKAFLLNGKTLFNTKITVNKSANFTDSYRSTRARTVFIKNLSYRAKEEDVKKLFKRFNPVDVRIPLSEEDPERNRGFAFIEFPDEQTAQNVRRKTWSFDDKKLFVDLSENRRGNEGHGRDSDRRRRGSSDRRGRDFDRKGDKNYNERRGGKDFSHRHSERNSNESRDRNSNNRHSDRDFSNRKFSRDGDKRQTKENFKNKKIVFQDSSDE